MSLKSGRAFRSESSIGESSPPGLLLAMGVGGADLGVRGAGIGMEGLGVGLEKGTGARFNPADGLRERGDGERGELTGLGAIAGRGAGGSAVRADGAERMRQLKPTITENEWLHGWLSERDARERRKGKFIFATIVLNGSSDHRSLEIKDVKMVRASDCVASRLTSSL
jgi:hypothetical protein